MVETDDAEADAEADANTNNAVVEDGWSLIIAIAIAKYLRDHAIKW